jgi:hypothetical protein
VRRRGDLKGVCLIYRYCGHQKPAPFLSDPGLAALNRVPLGLWAHLPKPPSITLFPPKTKSEMEIENTGTQTERATVSAFAISSRCGMSPGSARPIRQATFLDSDEPDIGSQCGP